MNTRLFSTALLMAAPLALVSTYGFANSSNNKAAAQRATDIAAPPQADIKPFEHAKLSLVQAVTDAQKEMHGNTLEARFEIWRGQPSYLIRTYTSNELWQERLNANSGQPISRPNSIPQDQLSSQLKKDVAVLQNVRTDFTQAVNNAEQKEGGQAILAAVDARPDGSVSYKLDLVRNDRLHVAMVDAQNGQVR